MKTHSDIPRIRVNPASQPIDSDSSAGAVDAPGQTLRIVDTEGLDDSTVFGSAPEAAAEYEILDHIGSGGMGTVDLARDRRLGRYVAIKRLKKNALQDELLKTRFVREARTAASLNHIHVVHVYALGEDEQGPYIVMEYVPGPGQPVSDAAPPPPFTLAERVQRDGVFELDEAVAILIKLCGAVEYAHQRGVIHRDLKPHNVLLDASGEPKVVDFGLAHVTRKGVSPLTVPGEKMLSIGYAPPEQEADAGTVDERADVYGLGALLYFCISGKNPRYFREADVPEALRPLITRALETDREKRWRSVSELRDALELLRNPTVHSVPTARTTWRCKWCDASNPVAIRFCGTCGWDGGEICQECGAEIRTGIQYCGSCGADARSYETALRLRDGLYRCRDEKDFVTIVQQAPQITQFHPSGPQGRAIVSDVQRLEAEAKNAIERVGTLGEKITRYVETENFEMAQRAIQEYRSLSDSDPYGGLVHELPSRILARDTAAAQHAVKLGDWTYAALLYRRILDSIAPDNADIQRMLKRVEVRIRQIRTVKLFTWFLCLSIVYLLSAGPVSYLAGGREAPMVQRLYAPALAAERALPERYRVVDRYIGWWMARGEGETVSEPDVPVESVAP